MNKVTLATLIIAVTGILFLGFSSADAQRHSMQEKMKGEKGGMHEKMMGKGMSGKEMPHMMGGMMQKKQVVPTEDGGVVVVIGNQLHKYDKKLEKIGETTIEISEEDMEKRMKHMKKMREKCMQMQEKEEDHEE